MDVGHVSHVGLIHALSAKTNRSVSPQPVGQNVSTGDTLDGSAAKRVDDATLASRVHQWNAHLADSQYTVEFDTAPGAGRTWLNVVDKSTGQVVYEVPSENVRRILQNTVDNTTGLAFDTRR